MLLLDWDGGRLWGHRAQTHFLDRPLGQAVAYSRARAAVGREISLPTPTPLARLWLTVGQREEVGLGSEVATDLGQ